MQSLAQRKDMWCVLCFDLGPEVLYFVAVFLQTLYPWEIFI
jgi:hypothetical protein